MTASPRTCLVADDHPSVLRSVTELLRGWGYTIVASTRNGGEALRKIEELEPAVALVDLNMPIVSGLEIVRASGKGKTAVVIYRKLDARTRTQAVALAVRTGLIA